MAKTNEFSEKKFFLGVWSFLQIKAKHKGQIKNASDQKTDDTFNYQLLKTRNFVFWPNMHFLAKIISIMGDVFFKRLDLPIKIATLQKWMVFD